MANYKKSKGHFWIGLISVILVCVIIFGVIGWGSEGFVQWNVGKWFNSWGTAQKEELNDEQQEQQEQQSGESVTGGLVVTPGASKGIKTMSTKIDPTDYAANGIDDTVMSAYELTIVTTPTNTRDKFSWAVSWGEEEFNGSSGSRFIDSDVNNYITLTIAEDTRSAVVTCLKNFDEYINLTVTSLINSEVTATCKLDFLSTIEPNSMLFLIDSDNFKSFVSTDSVGYENSKNCIIFDGTTKRVSGANPHMITLSYSYIETYPIEATMFPQVIVSKVTLKSNLGEVPEGLERKDSEGTYIDNTPTEGKATFIMNTDPYALFLDYDQTSTSEDDLKEFNQSFLSAATQTKTDLTIEIEYQVQNGTTGEVVCTETFTINVGIYVIWDEATEVATDTASLVFTNDHSERS